MIQLDQQFDSFISYLADRQDFFNSLLAGCSGFEAGHPGDAAMADYNVGAAKAALPNTSDFTGSLASNYYAMATIRDKQRDAIDADYWARKSMAAAHGEAVRPEQPKVVAEMTPTPNVRGAKQDVVHQTNWNIPGMADPANSSNVQDLHNGRDLLTVALDEGGRDRFPTLAARSQALYDCWIERSEANVTRDPNFAACRSGFIRDYTDLHVLLHPPGQRNAYFDYNSATLTAQGKKEIADAVAYIKDGTAKLQIIGKADRSGSAGYNMRLAERRAEAVKDAAVADGLSTDRIQVSWTGETQIPVATRDGAKEPRNRVVEIDTIMPASQVAALLPQE